MKGKRVHLLAVAVALGVGWLAIEFGWFVASSRALEVGEVARALVRALPWQVGCFVVLGAGVAWLPGLARARVETRGLALLGVATYAFLAPRIAEGGLRRDNVSSLEVAGTLALVGLALAVVLGAFAFATSRLPGRWGRAAAVALGTGWSLLFLPMLHRSATALGFFRPPPADLLFDGGELAFAGAAVVAVAGVLGLAPRAWPLLGILALVPLSARIDGDAAQPATGGRPRPDVVLLVIDTLRADHLGLETSTIPTPALDALLAESIRFERAWSGANRTLLAMPGVMTSLPASAAGHRLSPDVETLAEHLKKAGYATYGISANPLVSARLGYDQGFDWFSDAWDWPRFQIVELRRIAGVAAPGLAYRTGVARSHFYYRPASEIVRRASRLLETASRPCFLYLHTMDAHGPYLPPHRLLPESYRPDHFLSYFRFLQLAGEERFPWDERGEQVENLRQRYAGELRFTDEQLGRFVEALREAGLWDESLVWLLSDHGESFGEKGFAGHGGWNMTPSVLRVPLAVKLPRSFGLPPRADGTPVSSLDVLPTTLSLLGLPPPKIHFGHDLARPILDGQPPPGERILVAQGEGRGSRLYSALRGPWKLDLRFDARGEIAERALHNLDIDPEEKVDLSKAHPRVAAALEAEIRAHGAREREAFYRSWQREFDEDVREQLRRLGYLE